MGPLSAWPAQSIQAIAPGRYGEAKVRFQGAGFQGAVSQGAVSQGGGLS
jgi:hypothetical protein